MIKIKNHAFYELTGFVGFFYLLPISLLYFGVIPFRAMFGILILTGIILIAYAIDKPIKKIDLGIRTDNLKSALLLSGATTIIGLMSLLGLWKFGFLKSNYPPISVWFYIFYIFISVPLQEFIFRCLMIYELGIFFKSKWTKILLSAVIYSLAHSMYHNPTILLVTMTVGLIWGWVYIKKPNLYAITISHMVLGVATVALGII